MCLEYQCTLLHEAALHYFIPCKSWQVVGADIFMINNKNLICIVDYYIKFPLVKKIVSQSVQDLV